MFHLQGGLVAGSQDLQSQRYARFDYWACLGSTGLGPPYSMRGKR